VELFSYRFCPGVTGGKSQFFLFFIVYLWSAVRGFPHHFVSVWQFVALFIKRGESLFRGRKGQFYSHSVFIAMPKMIIVGFK
jgi:hypothetical protein